METERFFTDLNTRLDKARQADRMEYQRFFAELAPRLDTAKVLERELDRNLARRFNVLDYVKRDELGLSRIIADLLNPKASHGQETLFLRTLLGSLNKTLHWPALDMRDISVVVEQVITAERRIDVYVQIGGGDAAHCLAIENKPYSGDQENQIKDYLEYLKEKYGERFLLIYLSPKGKGPSERSIHKKELDQWKGRFAIMPYYRGQEEKDKFTAFRLPHSLAEWLGECRKNCEVDRLRWFLRDAEEFCQRKFGGQAMTTNSEKKAVRDFLLGPGDPKNLKSALAVYDSWPDVEADVCKRFLKQVCCRIEGEVKENEKLKGFTSDIVVKWHYEGQKKYSKWIDLYWNCWGPDEVESSISTRCPTIRLATDEKGPNGWWIGVRSLIPVGEMASGDKKRRQSLIAQLKTAFGRGESDDDWWPWWEGVDDKFQNWNSLVPDLHQECEKQGCEITRYFVDKFIEIAEKAIPIINSNYI